MSSANRTGPAKNWPHPDLLWLALGFYTRLPVLKQADDAPLSEAALYLPVVGWMVGALSALCFHAAAQLWPQPVAAALTLTAGVLITGAFHEDGLADVCDGFGGGWSREQILAIMKDSRIGAYGAIALSLQFVLKTALLSAVPAAAVPACLLAGHSVSRLMPLLIMYRHAYARSAESKSAGAVLRPTRGQLALAAALALLPCFGLPPAGWWALAAVMPVNLGLGLYFQNRIGGYTGDCLGASQQIAETVFYLGVSASWTFT